MSQHTISVAVNDVLLTQLTTLNNVQLSQDSQSPVHLITDSVKIVPL